MMPGPPSVCGGEGSECFKSLPGGSNMQSRLRTLTGHYRCSRPSVVSTLLCLSHTNSSLGTWRWGKATGLTVTTLAGREQVDSGRPLLIRLLTLETSSLMLSVECIMTVTPLQTLGNWNLPGTAWAQQAWVRAAYRTPAQPAVFKKVWMRDAAK